jgi:hypothetical protein
MMLEMMDGINANDRLLFGRALSRDYYNRNLGSPMQERHAFAQGTRSFPAAIPGYEDTIEGDPRTLRFRH